MARLLAFALRLEAAIARLSGWFAYAAAMAVALLLGLLVTSALKRYFLASPIPETEELASLLFLAMISLSLPYGFCTSRHVKLDMAWRHIPQPMRTYFEAGGMLLGALVLSVVVYYTYHAALFNLSIGARSEMNELLLWPWSMILPLCLALLAIALVVRAAVLGLSAATGKPIEPVGGLDLGPAVH